MSSIEEVGLVVGLLITLVTYFYKILPFDNVLNNNTVCHYSFLIKHFLPSLFLTLESATAT